MTVPQIEPWPPAPGPSDPGDVFDAKSFEYTAAMEPRRQQMNAVAEFINDTAEQFDQTVGQAVADATQAATDARDTAVSAAASASQDAADAEVFRNETEAARDAAIALVNFAGKWADLAGPLSTPATIFHNGAYWNLLNDLADVTTSEPANDNADWLFVYSNAELRRNLLDEATLYADFENGDYRLYEGVGSGVVRGKSFSDLFNFTRSSDATGQGVSTLETVTADVARFVYSPEIKKRQGLQIEDQRTDLLLRSQDFASSPWNAVNLSVTSDTDLSPDGTTTADTIQNAASGNNRVEQNVTLSVSEIYTFSIFVKPGNQNLVRVSVSSLGSVVFNAESGSFESFSPNISNFGFEESANGFLRLWFSGPAQSTGASTLTISAGSDPVGTPSVSVVAWGAQLEAGRFPTSYIKTEAFKVTRAADNCSRTLGAEFNGRHGTFLMSVDYLEYGSIQAIADVSDGTVSNRFLIAPNNSSSDMVWRSGGSPVASSGQQRFSEGKVLAAMSYSPSEILSSVNGSIPLSEGVGIDLSNATKIDVLWSEASNLTATQKGKFLAYIPRSLTPAELIALTQPEAE